MELLSSQADSELPIVIAGGGIAGLLSGILLARQGQRVVVMERRPNLFGQAPYSGRSVNFTLSLRGREMLNRAGILTQVLRHAVPLRGRCIHLADGSISFQAYGAHSHEILHSIRRSDLHKELLIAAHAESNLKVKFEHTLEAIDIDSATARFMHSNGKCEDILFSLFIGADGVFSKAQEILKKYKTVESQKHVSEWSYIEFEVPPRNDGKYSLDSGYLHLWPRGDALVCALPNSDGTLIANLIMPRKMFDTLRSPRAVKDFFTEKFNDLFDLTPGISDKFMMLPISEIITTSISSWHFGGKALLLGDACHAISPFLGQGMNAALEDATLFADFFKKNHEHIDEMLVNFQNKRKPDTDALGILSISHHDQLSVRLGSRWEITRHKAESQLAKWFPNLWKSVYSLIAHSVEPYSLALQTTNKSYPLSKNLILLGLQAGYYTIDITRHRIFLICKKFIRKSI